MYISIRNTESKINKLTVNKCLVWTYFYFLYTNQTEGKK